MSLKKCPSLHELAARISRLEDKVALLERRNSMLDTANRMIMGIMRDIEEDYGTPEP